MPDKPQTDEAAPQPAPPQGGTATPATTQTTDKSKLATWLPIAISLSALSVSLGSLYYERWREKHSLVAVVSSMDWSEGQVPVEVVIRNLGNKSEVLTDARLIWNKVDPGGGAVSKEHVGPLVIKPDESVVQKFVAELPTFKELKDSGQLDQDNGLHIGVDFSILDFRTHSTGSKIYIEKTIPFTVIHFDETGRVTGAKPTKEDAESFVELYSGTSLE